MRFRFVLIKKYDTFMGVNKYMFQLVSTGSFFFLSLSLRCYLKMKEKERKKEK